MASLGMVRTFQLTKALSKMTVLDNMMLGGIAQRGEQFAAAFVPPLWGQEEASSASGPRSCSSASAWPT